MKKASSADNLLKRKRYSLPEVVMRKYSLHGNSSKSRTRRHQAGHFKKGLSLSKSASIDSNDEYESIFLIDQTTAENYLRNDALDKSCQTDLVSSPDKKILQTKTKKQKKTTSGRNNNNNNNNNMSKSKLSKRLLSIDKEPNRSHLTMTDEYEAKIRNDNDNRVVSLGNSLGGINRTTVSSAELNELSASSRSRSKSATFPDLDSIKFRRLRSAFASSSKLNKPDEIQTEIPNYFDLYNNPAADSIDYRTENTTKVDIDEIRNSNLLLLFPTARKCISKSDSALIDINGSAKDEASVTTAEEIKTITSPCKNVEINNEKQTNGNVTHAQDDAMTDISNGAHRHNGMLNDAAVLSINELIEIQSPINSFIDKADDSEKKMFLAMNNDNNRIRREISLNTTNDEFSLEKIENLSKHGGGISRSNNLNMVELPIGKRTIKEDYTCPEDNIIDNLKVDTQLETIQSNDLAVRNPVTELDRSPRRIKSQNFVFEPNELLLSNETISIKTETYDTDKSTRTDREKTFHRTAMDSSRYDKESCNPKERNTESDNKTRQSKRSQTDSSPTVAEDECSSGRADNGNDRTPLKSVFDLEENRKFTAIANNLYENVTGDGSVITFNSESTLMYPTTKGIVTHTESHKVSIKLIAHADTANTADCPFAAAATKESQTTMDNEKSPNSFSRSNCFVPGEEKFPASENQHENNHHVLKIPVRYANKTESTPKPVLIVVKDSSSMCKKKNGCYCSENTEQVNSLPKMIRYHLQDDQPDHRRGQYYSELPALNQEPAEEELPTKVSFDNRKYDILSSNLLPSEICAIGREVETDKRSRRSDTDKSNNNNRQALEILSDSDISVADSLEDFQISQRSKRRSSPVFNSKTMNNSTYNNINKYDEKPVRGHVGPAADSWEESSDAMKKRSMEKSVAYFLPLHTEEDGSSKAVLTDIPKRLKRNLQNRRTMIIRRRHSPCRRRRDEEIAKHNFAICEKKDKFEENIDEKIKEVLLDGLKMQRRQLQWRSRNVSPKIHNGGVNRINNNDDGNNKIILNNNSTNEMKIINRERKFQEEIVPQHEMNNNNKCQIKTKDKNNYTTTVSNDNDENINNNNNNNYYNFKNGKHKNQQQSLLLLLSANTKSIQTDNAESERTQTHHRRSRLRRSSTTPKTANYSTVEYYELINLTTTNNNNNNDYDSNNNNDNTNTAFLPDTRRFTSQLLPLTMADDETKYRNLRSRYLPERQKEDTTDDLISDILELKTNIKRPALLSYQRLTKNTIDNTASRPAVAQQQRQQQASQQQFQSKKMMVAQQSSNNQSKGFTKKLTVGGKSKQPSHHRRKKTRGAFHQKFESIPEEMNHHSSTENGPPLEVIKSKCNKNDPKSVVVVALLETVENGAAATVIETQNADIKKHLLPAPNNVNLDGTNGALNDAADLKQNETNALLIVSEDTLTMIEKMEEENNGLSSVVVTDKQPVITTSTTNNNVVTATTVITAASTTDDPKPAEQAVITHKGRDALLSKPEEKELITLSEGWINFYLLKNSSPEGTPNKDGDGTLTPSENEPQTDDLNNIKQYTLHIQATPQSTEVNDTGLKLPEITDNEGKKEKYLLPQRNNILPTIEQDSTMYNNNQLNIMAYNASMEKTQERLKTLPKLKHGKYSKENIIPDIYDVSRFGDKNCCTDVSALFDADLQDSSKLSNKAVECNMGSPRGANCAETFTKRYNNYKGGLKSKYSSSEGNRWSVVIKGKDGRCNSPEVNMQLSYKDRCDTESNSSTEHIWTVSVKKETSDKYRNDNEHDSSINDDENYLPDMIDEMETKQKLEKIKKMDVTSERSSRPGSSATSNRKFKPKYDTELLIKQVKTKLQNEFSSKNQKSELNIRGNTATPDKRPRIPTLSERDLIRMKLL